MADKVTEGEMLGLLRQRHTEKAGNGDAWAFITHVRSAAGFDSKRTIDGLAMSLWPSRGLQLIGYEVKCSRSDWLREMRDPAKAEEFCTKLDRFYLVVSDAKIVHDGELPPMWGLLVKQGARLVQKVEAPLLREANGALPPAFDRSFLAALMRAACVVGGATPAEITEAAQEARALAERTFEQRITNAEAGEKRLQQQVREFERASGLSLAGYTRGANDAAALGRAVKVVLDGEFQVENVRKRLDRHAAEAQQIADFAKRMADEMSEPQTRLEVA